MASFDADKIKHIHDELHSHLPNDSALRVKALESILIEKGIVQAENIDKWVQAYTEEVGPKRGAELVARAWMDANFKDKLLANAPKVVCELGYHGPGSGHLTVVENTDKIHNIVVCTLCSCYPFALLGMAPTWYKTAAYRSRVVRDPRGVLDEFGVVLQDDVEVRVWDSTSELRYLVLPQQPQDTDGWSVEQLASCVTRNSMIGTQRDLAAKGDVA